MRMLRIAQAQINPVVGGLEGNGNLILRWIGRAKTMGADIVTFPELALCGYPPEDLLLKPRFVRDNRLAVERLAPECKGITVLVGFADSKDDKVFNAAALIHDGDLIDVYHKVELPNYGVFDEKRYFEPGSCGLVFDMLGWRFSATVCEDIWIPGSLTEQFALKNRADVALNLSASPFHAGKLRVREQVAVRFARATGSMVFFNNLVGGQDELVFDGGSLVMDADGAILARADRFEEDLLVFDLEGGKPTNRPSSFRLCGNRESPYALEALGRAEKPEIESSRRPEPDRLEEVYRALVLGTRDYVRKNGFTRVVLGLSGGIDSALTAAVAVDALGAEHVVGVTMPSQYTSEETFSDAEVIARNLGIELIQVPVRNVFESYLDALTEPFREGEPGIAEENIQARIRGNILMALSNRFGWLVLTTGNKSETAVGYCTLYGDMAGGFAVIKDVPKTLVYELSEYVNNKAGQDVIPRSVIERAPSAELRPEQRDEDSLPPYEILDTIVHEYVEEDRAPDEIIAKGFARELVEEVVAMVDRNEYKRRQAPPGVKITPKAFGRDRRLPITSRYLKG
jgi:NAD+ synthase (glutamine-hydrolysing)